MQRSEEWQRKMRALKAEYLAGLAGQVPFLSAAAAQLASGTYESGALHQLCDMVHRLRGSAGFYGEPHLSELAAAVEEPLVASLRSGAPLRAAALAAAVAQLARAIAAAARAHTGRPEEPG